MIVESLLTLLPGLTLIAAAGVVVFAGYTALSCTVARMQHKTCA